MDDLEMLGANTRVITLLVTKDDDEDDPAFWNWSEITDSTVTVIASSDTFHRELLELKE